MGRPRVALLSRDKIGTAALKLVSRDGDFTMPGLARELGVQVAAVYHHVPAGRSEVIEMVRVLVAQNIDDAAFDRLPWDEAFVVWTRSYLDAFSGHPAAVRLLATEPIRDPDLIAAYNPVAAGLSRAGFVDGEIIAVITAVENFVLGAALDASAPDLAAAADQDGIEPELRRALDAAPSGAARARQAFDLGVSALVAGLRARLP
ncbi:TetR/AcrR family transcriptional regulator [Mycolicibacterium sp.]|uniref:TetR/AcrR family transcriptional regulator n=1 Tax=Mycolicibacterium sp. TaxID=2320850 RepID=UPI0037C7E946